MGNSKIKIQSYKIIKWHNFQGTIVAQNFRKIVGNNFKK